MQAVRVEERDGLCDDERRDDVQAEVGRKAGEQYLEQVEQNDVAF